MSRGWYCSLPLAHGAVDWSAVYECHTHVVRIGHIFELLKNWKDMFSMFKMSVSVRILKYYKLIQFYILYSYGVWKRQFYCLIVQLELI